MARPRITSSCGSRASFGTIYTGRFKKTVASGEVSQNTDTVV